MGRKVSKSPGNQGGRKDAECIYEFKKYETREGKYSWPIALVQDVFKIPFGDLRIAMREGMPYAGTQSNSIIDIRDLLDYYYQKLKITQDSYMEETSNKDVELEQLKKDQLILKNEMSKLQLAEKREDLVNSEDLNRELLNIGANLRSKLERLGQKHGDEVIKDFVDAIQDTIEGFVNG